MTGLDTIDVRHCSPAMTLNREAASRNLEMAQGFKYFNCGEQVHPSINFKEKQIKPQGKPMLSGICQRFGKG